MKHISYKYVILAISFISVMVVNGLFFSSGILFTYIVKDFNWSYRLASMPFSVALASYALFSWIPGKLFDRFGPRLLFPFGVLIFGAGLIGVTLSRSPMAFCFTWGILVGTGYTVIGFVPNVTQVALWFRERRGLATSVVVSGVSVGIMVFVPTIQHLCDTYGWRETYLIAGCLFICLLLPLNAFGQRRSETLRNSSERNVPASRTPSDSGEATSLSGALRSPAFWLLVVFSAAVGWLSQLVGVHQFAFLAERGIAPLAAAAAIGSASVLRAVSTLFWGSISDRIGREVSFTVGSILCISSLAVVVFQQSLGTTSLYIYAALFAIGFSVQGTTQATATGDIFGRRHLGAILGALELGWGLGGIGGTSFAGYWHDRFGTYQGILAISMSISLIGIVSLWLAAPRHHRRSGRKTTMEGARRQKDRRLGPAARKADLSAEARRDPAG